MQVWAIIGCTECSKHEKKGPSCSVQSTSLVSGSKRGRRSLVLKQDIKEMEKEVKLRAGEVNNPRNIRERLIDETTERLKKLHNEFRMITPEVLERIKYRKAQKQVKV